MSTNGGVRQAMGTVVHSRRFRILAVLLFLMGLVMGLVIVPVEVGASGSNIRSVEDGLWWAVTTITGVGFGDLYPVTTWGRVIGAFLEVVGVVLFGAVIALVSISLLRYQEDFYVRRLSARFDDLEKKLDELKARVEFLVKGK